MEYETFYGKVRTSGGISLEVTLPMNLCEFAGIKEGDTLKIMVQKIKEVQEK